MAPWQGGRSGAAGVGQGRGTPVRQGPDVLRADSDDGRTGRPIGTGRHAWRLVRPLPFELAVLPHRLYKWLRLPVVSYALPALIAIGQARYEHLRPGNPLTATRAAFTARKSLSPYNAPA